MVEHVRHSFFGCFKTLAVVGTITPQRLRQRQNAVAARALSGGF